MPAVCNWRQTLMRHVVFPIPGNPTIIKWGLALMESLQATSSSFATFFPKTTSIDPCRSPLYFSFAGGPCSVCCTSEFPMLEAGLTKVDTTAGSSAPGEGGDDCNGEDKSPSSKMEGPKRKSDTSSLA